MHALFVGLTRIHLDLIRDDVAAAKERAAAFAQYAPAAADADAPWRDAVRYFQGQTGRLLSARSAREARELSAELATYCADCHMVSTDPSRFQIPPEPAEGTSPKGIMAHHQWAAELLWLGVIAPSGDLWKRGLAAFAASPPIDLASGVSSERQVEVDRLNRRLVEIASRTRAPGDLEGQGDRAARLAEVMDVCASCHALTRR